MLPRVIPCLLLRNGGLVKTLRFRAPRYIGDPINAVRQFNDKEVDELVILDIGCREPDFALLADSAGEAFMPLAYGGGIRNIEQIRRLYALGVEKVILNGAAAATPALVTEAAALAGSSGVVVALDVRRSWRGRYSVCVDSGQRDLKREPADYARQMEQLGAGEILLNAIDRDGTMEGYDLDLLRRVAAAVSVPLVAVGGAGELQHLRQAEEQGASAVAAGSLFVFHGRHKAVLITYPDYEQLERLFA